MRRPWNIIDSPVYCLATYEGERVNMNICTYVTAVSRKPKRYIIALEEGSLSLKNLQSNPVAVLQILAPSQMDLVRPLGKKSGHKYDKDAWLSKRDRLEVWKGRKVLKDASAYLLLRSLQHFISGDHTVFELEATGYKTRKEEVLMFQQLIDHKIILG